MSSPDPKMAKEELLPVRFSRFTLRFDRPVIMGVVNVTPDSFSDGGQFTTVERALERARVLARDGAKILDVGGESTRPGSDPVSAREEIARVIPVIEAIAAEGLRAAVSIDTAKAEVAAAALQAGAEIVNDVSALRDPFMAPVAVKHGAALILMHMRGTPKTMQAGTPHYDDLVGEIRAALMAAVEVASRAGVARERVFLDPGVGFGKTVTHNLVLTKELHSFAETGHPIVYGPSRKSFLGAITGRTVTDRDRATAAACAIAVLEGANILRVHDAEAVKDAIAVATAMRTTHE